MKQENLDKKYELTDEMISFFDRKLFRIKALKDFSSVRKGDLGGFAQSEKNLSQRDNCWVYKDAKVFDKARIFGKARISEKARIFGHAYVLGTDIITGPTSTINGLCEFNITISKEDRLIRVGCKSHSVDEWLHYIESGIMDYEKECKSPTSHQICINLILSIVKTWEIESQEESVQAQKKENSHV